MSKRTDSKPAKTSQLGTIIDADLHREAKSALAKKGKTFREVVEKSLRAEVATAK